MKNYIGFSFCLAILFPVFASAQGQDSHTADRDLQVIATMLSGGYDNANQNYFDKRGKHEVQHRRIHMTIESLDRPEAGSNVFKASAFWDSDPEIAAGNYLFSLAPNYEAGAVEMQVWVSDSDFSMAGSAKTCSLFWHRGAAEFKAKPGKDCADPVIRKMVLSEKQLWMSLPGVENGDFKLHRIRSFECYADIPGVGGGRDEPYERYENFKIHDQGGAVWFTSKDDRKLGISLFLVDWPINNYEGIFTRDSLVIYVSEETEGTRKEHGYAFTEPDANRVGINLKWMLASCFMKSNRDATPAM